VTSQYEDVVDLARYPIDDPAGPAYQDLVRVCRDQLSRHGVAQLDGFLTPAAVSQMLALASTLAGQAWASDQTHTVYFEPPDESEGPDHPRALLQHSAKKAIAYDQIFRGQHALHRVTPVSGPRPRINSVLTYGEHPGMKLSELTQKLFYGRTA
jgi:hypothetical protein